MTTIAVSKKADIDSLAPGTSVELKGKFQTTKKVPVGTKDSYETVDAFELMLEDEPVSVHLANEWHERMLVYGCHMGPVGKSGKIVERGDGIYIKTIINVYTDPESGEQQRTLWATSTRVLPATLSVS